MLISHRCKFIYMKTKKTAGTSVEMAFEPFCRENLDDPVKHMTDTIICDQGVVGARLGGDSGPMRYFNHMSARAIKRRVGEPVWSDYLKFCAIRNPWDKVVSMFHYRHPKIQAEAPAEIIATFRQWLVADDTVVGDDWNVYTIDDEPVFDVVIRHDQLEKDTVSLLKHFGASDLAVPRMKVRHRKDVTLDHTAYYDDAAREMVAETFDNAIKLFGWRFEDLAPDHPGASDDPRFPDGAVPPDWTAAPQQSAAPR